MTRRPSFPPGSDRPIFLLMLHWYVGGPASDPSQHAPFLAPVAGQPCWMQCVSDAMEHPCLIHAARLGGDLRVGFENNLAPLDATPSPDDAAALAALVGAPTRYHRCLPQHRLNADSDIKCCSAPLPLNHTHSR